MNWKLWAPWYRKIVGRLNIDEKADNLSARALNLLLPEPKIDELRAVLNGRECVVFGAGPSLDEDLAKLSLSGRLEKILISADGATTAVLKYKTPDVVVTDLDGNIDDQLKAWRRGAWLVVHAHGDNMQEIEKVVPLVKERIIGTTQIKPFERLFNFGGFTDGDRAAFMAHELGASKIYLAGMDLGEKIGKHSGKKDMTRKRVKLEICKELLAWLALKSSLVNLTSHGEPIPDVRSEERMVR
ncbi:MAG: 6-hydroxymethylpterin diphosphokinase MptE-like protein [Candidatus Hadarchaeota archaeon]